jgi:hypothetical protein
MNKSRFRRGFAPILFAFIMIFNTACSNMGNSAEERLRKQLDEAANKTIQYYYDTYKPLEFNGILDWPALGLYGFGEDVSAEVWTVNGKNGAYWREQQVKNGDGLSKVKNTDYERTIIGVTAAGKDPRNFGGHNLVQDVKNTMLPNGHFADSVEDRRTGKPIGEDLINAQCFGVIALHCAGEPIPNRDKCIRWLERNQHYDGGFTWDVKDYSDPEDYIKIPADVDMTAAALMAFAILGMDENYTPVARALEFLKKQQLDDGGFASWGTVNPESAAWVIQALTLLGENPMGKKWTKPSGDNPVNFLLKFQVENGGFTHVLHEKDMLPVYDNGLTTYECLYAMADAYNGKSAYDMLYEENRPKAEKNIFSDYKEGDTGFEQAVELVYDYVMSGYLDGSFKPEKAITKGELSRYLANALDLQDEFYKRYSGDELKLIRDEYKTVLEVDDDNNYVELCKNKSFFENIESLDKQGEIDKEISGQEFMAVLINASGLIEKAKDEHKEGKEWSYGYKKAAEKHDFIYEGFENEKVVKRGQSAVSLLQFKKYIDKNK